MPNTVVKLFCADGSWGLPPVRVGHCQAYIISKGKQEVRGQEMLEEESVHQYTTD